jgi:hypothetical protein
MLETRITRSRVRRSAAALLAGVALAVVPGCGPFGSDEDDVKDVVKDYMEGVAEGDGKKVCDTLAEDSRKQFEQAGTKCEDTFKSFGAFLNDEQKEQLKDDDPEVEIDGDNATADVDALGNTGSTKVKLKKEDGDWKITFDQQ